MTFPSCLLHQCSTCRKNNGVPFTPSESVFAGSSALVVLAAGSIDLSPVIVDPLPFLSFFLTGPKTTERPKFLTCCPCFPPLPSLLLAGRIRSFWHHHFGLVLSLNQRRQ